MTARAELQNSKASEEELDPKCYPWCEIPDEAKQWPMAVERERELPGSALVADIYQKEKHRGNFERIKRSES